MNNYFIEENVLTDDECVSLINFYNQNTSDVNLWHNQTIPVPIHTLRVIQNPVITNLNVFKLIENKYKNIFNYNKLDNLEIVKWPETSYAIEHFDGDDKMAFFIHLNDEFEGGENELVNIHKVKPKKGRMSLFDNGKILHKVNKVSKGDRFMLAGWYQ